MKLQLRHKISATVVALAIGLLGAVVAVPVSASAHTTGLDATAQCAADGTRTVSYTGTTTDVPDGVTGTLTVPTVDPAGSKITIADATVATNGTYKFTQEVSGTAKSASATAHLEWVDSVDANGTKHTVTAGATKKITFDKDCTMTPPVTECVTAVWTIDGTDTKNPFSGKGQTLWKSEKADCGDLTHPNPPVLCDVAYQVDSYIDNDASRALIASGKLTSSAQDGAFLQKFTFIEAKDAKDCTPTPPTKPNPEKGSDTTYAADCGPTLVTTVTPWTQDYTLDTKTNTWVKGPKVTGTPVVTTAPATQADLDAHGLTVPTRCTPTPPTKPNPEKGSDTVYAANCGPTLTTTVTPWTQDYTLDTKTNTWVKGPKVTGTPVVTTAPATQADLDAHGLTVPTNCVPPQPKDLSGSDTTHAVDCALTLTTTVTPWTQTYTLDTASNTWVLGAKVTGAPASTTSTTTIDALPALGLTAPTNCAVTPPVTPPTPPVTPPTPPVTPPTTVVAPPAVEAPVVTPVTKVDSPTVKTPKVTTPKVEAPVVKATDTDSTTSLASTGINDSTPIAGDLALGALTIGAALIAIGAIRRRRALTK